jgi:urease accessory protein
VISDVLIVARPGREPHIDCSGGLAARRTERDTVHLVSAAATPLGGDAISVRVVVEAGAALVLRTAAATMVLPSTSTPESRAAWDLEVHGELDVDPQPTIVAGGSHHTVSTRLALGAAGRVRIRERAQIGRAFERHGFWSAALHADVDDTPLLRHRVELGTGAVADDALGTPLACVSEFRYPEPTFDTEGELLELAAGGCLATWQGPRL